MKSCTHCKINVGGKAKHCPLCQSPLMGEADVNLHWPDKHHLKRISLLLKVVLFVILAGAVTLLTIDYQLLGFEHKHFSLPIIFYIFVALITFYWYYKSHRSVPVMLFRGMIISSIVLWYTAKMYGGYVVCMTIVIPVIFLAVLVMNFIFCFIDAGFTEDSMLCILLNVIIGIIPNLAMIIWRGTIPALWTITLLLSIITLLAIIIFKGRLFITEIQKRMNI